MSNLQKIFDDLLAGQELTVQCTYGEAESLRTTLLKKFKSYKEKWDAIGYFDPELSKKTFAHRRDGDCYIFSFRIKRPVKHYNYTVLPKEEIHGADV